MIDQAIAWAADEIEGFMRSQRYTTGRGPPAAGPRSVGYWFFSKTSLATSAAVIAAGQPA
jgi:hypothetical protein